jgi:hypothetical protein
MRLREWSRKKSEETEMILEQKKDDIAIQSEDNLLLLKDFSCRFLVKVDPVE